MWIMNNVALINILVECEILIGRHKHDACMRKKIVSTFATAAADADFFIGFHNHLSVNKHVIIRIQSAQTQRGKNRQSFGCIFKHIFRKPENPID